MIKKLPIVTTTGLALLLALQGIGVESDARPEARERVAASDNLAVAGNSKHQLHASGADGNVLVLQAVKKVSGFTAVSASIRFRAKMFDQEVRGAGQYWQLSVNDEKLMRMNLKGSVGDQLARYQRISDGRFLWRWQVFPTTAGWSTPGAVLERVELRKVRERLAQRKGISVGDPASHPLNGIPQLLAELERNFTFSKSEKRNFRSVPVQVLRGTWKPQLLSLLLHRPEDASTPMESMVLPDEIPESVELTLDQKDLFPYRIRFLGRQNYEPLPPIISAGKNVLDAKLVVEFYEVSIGETIDPWIFNFRPAIPYTDTTDAFLSRL